MLLYFLLRLDLDPAKVGAELARSNLWLVGLAVGLVLPFIALKAWRWKMILADLGITIPFGRAYRLFALGLSAGSFTPGQAGDFIKAWHLSQQGFSLGMGIVSVVLDRLFDIAALMLLAFSGLLLLGSDFFSLLPALFVLLAGTLAALVALSVPAWRARLLRLALKIFLRKNPAEAEAEQRLQPVNFREVLLLTLASTALALFRIWLLALSLGLHLGFLEVVAASSLATVVSLIPVSVGGIGARDLALVGILGKLGYSSEQAVGLSIFILLLNLVNLLAGYLVWLARPKS